MEARSQNVSRNKQQLVARYTHLETMREKEIRIKRRTYTRRITDNIPDTETDRKRETRIATRTYFRAISDNIAKHYFFFFYLWAHNQHVDYSGAYNYSKHPQGFSSRTGLTLKIKIRMGEVGKA